jgi:drug/metabolite transporter (DMT)-like permease
MPFLGELSALATAVLWSVSSMVFTAAIVRVGPIPVNLARLVFATAYVSVVVLPGSGQLRATGGQLFWFGLSGVVGLTLGDTFLFKAAKEIGARLSMLIMSLAPPIAALLAFAFLGEGLSLLGILGIAVTIGGVAMAVSEQGEKSPAGTERNFAGILFALLAATGQAVGLVLAKQGFNQAPINNFLATMIRIVASLGILLPGMAAAGRLGRSVRTITTDRKALALTAAGAIIGPFLGMALSLVAVAHTGVGVAATLMATVPIIMLPLVRVFYRERLSWKAVSGAFVAVAGIGILFLRA